MIRNPREYRWTANWQHLGWLYLLVYGFAIVFSTLMGAFISIPFSEILYNGLWGAWLTPILLGVPALTVLFIMYATLGSVYKNKTPLNEPTKRIIERYTSLPKADRMLFGNDFLETVKYVNPESRYDRGEFCRNTETLFAKIERRDEIRAKMTEPAALEMTSRIERLKQSHKDLDIEIEVYREYS